MQQMLFCVKYFRLLIRSHCGMQCENSFLCLRSLVLFVCREVRVRDTHTCLVDVLLL